MSDVYKNVQEASSALESFYSELDLINFHGDRERIDQFRQRVYLRAAMQDALKALDRLEKCDATAIEMAVDEL